MIELVGLKTDLFEIKTEMVINKEVVSVGIYSTRNNAKLDVLDTRCTNKEIEKTLVAFGFLENS